VTCIGWLETVLYSECRHRKQTELRITSVKKLKSLLLSHSAVCAVNVSKADILKLLFIPSGDQFRQNVAERLIKWTSH